MKKLLLTTEILGFIAVKCVEVKENEPSDYVELMMDNHKCIEFEGKQYYLPKDCSGYTKSDKKVREFLIDNCLV